MCALLVACGTPTRPPKVEPAPAAPPDAAPPDAVAIDAGPFDAFDAALAAVGLTRATGDGKVIHSASCDGATVTAQYQGGTVEVKFGGCFRCELDGALDPRLIAEFAAALADEPPAFYAHSGVTTAAICTHLTNEVPMELTDGRLIGGNVDAAAGMILLSVEPMELSGADIVHHELWHAFDLVTDFALFKDDPAWVALNTEPYEDSDEVRPGFLNQHAGRNLREDHATVYQYLMARPDELCAADAIVLAKAKMIRDRVALVLGDARYLEQRAPCLKD